ncbi:unnamed protein product [Lactuca virosa]|uniref:Uncharacterized protein n=1 Tax=Lactuca virosa TaxID=75947 RepID=A0AAU9LSA7_9ASTR|nr:unnamed protein product [Lactuca virosa]
MHATQPKSFRTYKGFLYHPNSLSAFPLFFRYYEVDPQRPSNSSPIYIQSPTAFLLASDTVASVQSSDAASPLLIGVFYSLFFHNSGLTAPVCDLYSSIAGAQPRRRRTASLLSHSPVAATQPSFDSSISTRH